MVDVGFVSKLSYHAKAKGMRERERERGEATWKSYSTEWRNDRLIRRSSLIGIWTNDTVSSAPHREDFVLTRSIRLAFKENQDFHVNA